MNIISMLALLFSTLLVFMLINMIIKHFCVFRYIHWHKKVGPELNSHERKKQSFWLYASYWCRADELIEEYLNALPKIPAIGEKEQNPTPVKIFWRICLDMASD